MLIQHPNGIGALGPVVVLADPPGDRRAALYLSSVRDGAQRSPALLVCARQARQQGLRVVTVVAEEYRGSIGEQPRAGLGGERLRTLVDRLRDGQFDVIVAHTGDAMVMIGEPMTLRQGGAA